MDREARVERATDSGDPVCWAHQLCPECGAMPTAETPGRCWRCNTPLGGGDAPAAAGGVTVWHNPQCSKSRGALALLAEHGIEPEVVRYLDTSPRRGELEDVLRKLGTDDPLAITRTGEPLYRELGLAGVGREELLDALAAHPVLIERPIVVVGDRAVVARPAERVLDLVPDRPAITPVALRPADRSSSAG